MITRTKLLLLVPRMPASAPLRGLLLAAWWARPSSPRPDLRRLRRAPGRGRFVHVFLHPGALPNAFVSSCACCWHLWVSLYPLLGLVGSLWHFGWPWGSIVAPWASILTHMGYSWEAFRHIGETMGLHFGTLGLHLGTGVRGGTQLIDYENKALVTCTSNACFRSATWASTGSLVAPSKEDASEHPSTHSSGLRGRRHRRSPNAVCHFLRKLKIS